MEKSKMKETSALMKYGLLLAFIILIVALFYPRESEIETRVQMDKVLQSLLVQEKSVDMRHQAKIAVGYGACKDMFVNGKDVLKSFDNSKSELRNHNEIKTWDQLLEMYGYFFSHGAAAERFCSNEDLFDDLISKSEKLKDVRVALGGNAPVMANRFALEGANVLLAAKMTKNFQQTIHENIQVVGDLIESDDIHLILEYKRNEKWGTLQSPRANRFIIHSDINNPTISSVESFDEPLKKYHPDLMVVGGLQMMDNFPFAEGERRQRLNKVQNQMKLQSSKTRVHFEMASFVDETLLEDLTELIIPFADSLGMNEQELPNLRSMLLYKNVSVVSDSNPRTAVTLDHMRDVYRILSSNEGRPLTRLHLHTLAYQAILVSEESAWKNTRFAAAKASLTANRHVCASPKVDLDKALLLMDDSFATSAGVDSERIRFNDERPVACWTETIQDVAKGANPKVEICLAPNLVCSEAKQTAGGGDNISAAGLVLQI